MTTAIGYSNPQSAFHVLTFRESALDGRLSGMLIWKAVSSHPPMQDNHQLNVDDGLVLHNRRRNQLQKRRCKISGPQTPLLYWSTFWYPSSICNDEDVDRQKSKSACIRKVDAQFSMRPMPPREALQISELYHQVVPIALRTKIEQHDASTFCGKSSPRLIWPYHL